MSRIYAEGANPGRIKYPYLTVPPESLSRKAKATENISISPDDYHDTTTTRIARCCPSKSTYRKKHQHQKQ